MALHYQLQSFGPGEQVQNPQPGDFVLTRGHAWTSRLIQFGQGLHYWGNKRRFKYFTHSALFVGNAGEIIEAIGSGVCEGNISKYKPQDYTVVCLKDVSSEDRRQEVEFAQSCVRQHYGFVQLISVAISLLFGSKLSISYDRQQICSGLVARALERTGYIFRAKEPWKVMPADLAFYFEVEPPKRAKRAGMSAGK